MANLCSFVMKIRGTQDNCNLFLEALEQRKTVYMGRGAEIDYEVEYHEYDDKLVETEFSGWCKWSITSSLIDNAIDMRDNPNRWSFHVDPNTLTFVTLTEAAQMYNVDCEVFSEEPGCEFQEHILIRNGILECNETADYYSVFVDGCITKEEAEMTLGRSISDDEWKIGYELTSGGFIDEYDGTWHFDL